MSLRYLITGGTGSFGKTMLATLLKSNVESVTILSRDEEKQDKLRNELLDERVQYRIGDVRDYASVDSAMNGIDHVFHAAALKQVPSCEFFPMQAIQTNVHGSENVIKAAIKHKANSVVCLSTDKAVFPVNAMGMSKALMEKVAQAAARELGAGADTVISCVRYGNVMYSRGSVIPLFVSQIKGNRSISLTVPEMTRFLMPLSESVSLVKFAFDNSQQGDLFVQKAGAASLLDLVSALKIIFKKPDHPVETIGWRHGEKLYETLASSQELSTGEDLGKYWRIVTDLRDLNYNKYFFEGDRKVAVLEDFNSHNTVRFSVDEIVKILLSLPEIQTELSD